jgi:hypothetical protein
VCRSCTAELDAASYPDAVERWKQAMIEAMLAAEPGSGSGGPEPGR